MNGELPLLFWLISVFAIGAAVGSFLNVCIYRLPLEKSLLWPSSRCGHCLQPIHWYDNIPLLSYWLLKGRCRACGAGFSSRYFFVELLTALGFVALYYLEVTVNVRHFDGNVLGPERLQTACLTSFAYHATLFCFLLVSSFCDYDRRIIPLSVTITGTVVGLAGAVLWPWPWPYTPAEAAVPPGPWWLLNPRLGPRVGLMPWPVWGPLPAWLQPGGNWQTGLASGVAGLLVGTLMLRHVRFCFGLGMGPAYMDDAPEEQPSWFGGRAWSWLQRLGGGALGLGDADLMMMAGAFLGWQPIILAFFVGVFPGMFLGLAQLACGGGNKLPFGPALALGVLITMLTWHWLGPGFQPFFFNDFLLLFLIVVSSVFMVLGGLVIRLLKRGGVPNP